MRKLIILIFSLVLMSFNVINDNYSFSSASYYGKEHHGKRMANGKKFNMNALTTAHKTFRLGTKLEVTNTSNDKSVVVEVTDRGPFVKGRDLDLSKAAFQTIASIKSGHINVKYKILN